MTTLVRIVSGLGCLGVGMLGGCWIINPCACPDPEPFDGGRFTFSETSDPHVIEGTIDALDRERVIIDYIDEDGNQWEVIWTVTESGW
ncbi:MAG: hypothetical protein AAFV53_33960 [Myxococcota bacterium]